MKRSQFEKAAYCMIPNINMWHSGKGKSIEKVIASDRQEVGGVELVDHLGIFKDCETVLYVIVMVHLSKSIELYSTMKFNICKFLKKSLGLFLSRMGYLSQDGMYNMIKWSNFIANVWMSLIEGDGGKVADLSNFGNETRMQAKETVHNHYILVVL